MFGSHCTYCGNPLGDQGWPKTCPACKQVSYRNPLPVGVLCVPVETDGLLLVQRDIEPQKGLWALPGGYMEIGESWEHTCARELREETGFTVLETGIMVLFVGTTPGGVVIIFGSTRQSIPRSALQDFRPNLETQALRVITEPEPLAFPLHTEAARRFFSQRAA
jgi:ADP-ribose pyrophosphatase YjhB (NUDIX family)